jgi:hypothetical protein
MLYHVIRWNVGFPYFYYASTVNQPWVVPPVTVL